MSQYRINDQKGKYFNMTRRNGKIEFFRFIFCMTIIFFHLNLTYFDLEYQIGENFSFFKHGRIGVEFFFIVTGYLFARSCYQTRESKIPLGKDTIQFVFHKWFALFPFHVIAFAITFITIVIVRQLSFTESIARLIKGMPNFFLIQRTGIYAENIIGVEWYVSVMLLSLFILYPVCKRNYDVFTRILAPLTGVFLVGYLSEKYGYLSGASLWDGIISKAQLRGLAEICLGAFAFEVSRFIGRYVFSKFQRFILSCIEYGCYLAVLIFTCSQVGVKYEPYALYMLAVAVCLSFSGVTYGQNLFQNRVCLILGKMSLPVYLSQNAVRLAVEHYCKDTLPVSIQFLIILVGVFSLSVIIYVFGNILGRFFTSFLQNCKNNAKSR